MSPSNKARSRNAVRAIFGVTKGCAGSVPVARAMLDGGLAGLADSRLAHLKKLRVAFPDAPLMALRQPMRAEMRELVALHAIAVVSDADAARALDAAAREIGHRQAIVLMIEVGNGREGISPESLRDFARNVGSHRGLHLVGVAVNTGCRGGRNPDRATMRILDDLVGEVERAGFPLEIISAGNSSCWRLLDSGGLATTANHLRLGEAILLGLDPVDGRPLPGFHLDAFTLRAEVIESAFKLGEHRVVIAVGCQDTGAGELVPVDTRQTLDRLSSDHCVLIVSEDVQCRSGDLVDFIPSYLALQSLADARDVRTSYISYNAMYACERNVATYGEDN